VVDGAVEEAIIDGVWDEALQEPLYTEEGAVEAARGFIESAPTYAYDGVPGSIVVEGVCRARTPVPTWLVELGFQCRHSGYGDRSGLVLLQVVTPHTASIIVEERNVIQAVIDQTWDEIRQEKVDGATYTEEEAVEGAEAFVARAPTYAFDGVPGSIKVVYVKRLESAWTWQVTLEFSCLHSGYGDRSDDAPPHAVTGHVIRVIVQRGLVVGALIDGVWDEIRQVEEVQSELLPPEEARDLVVAYLIENEPALSGLEPPSRWEVEVLTPPDILGYSTQMYTGDGWNVTVSHAVVPRPIYDVEARYSGETAIHWWGIVDQEGIVSGVGVELVP
jgi:hypothetical protein